MCHGNLGVIDYLIYRYNITGNEILLEKAKKIFSNIIRKQKNMAIILSIHMGNIHLRLYLPEN
ncbi:TPA: lanthionine synthetase LanC family protein [Staphylococcus aureus]